MLKKKKRKFWTVIHFVSTLTHTLTMSAALQNVCLTHLSEIIQFSGWIRLWVLRAEIKIKTLNKQGAYLSPIPPAGRFSPSISHSPLPSRPPFPVDEPGFPFALLYIRVTTDSRLDFVCFIRVQVSHIVSQSIGLANRQTGECVRLKWSPLCSALVTGLTGSG